MKITKMFLVCICCLTVALIAWSQTTDNPAGPGILGYLDPQTGAFRPAHPSAQVMTASALPVSTGKIDLTLTITVKTAGLTNISCAVHARVDDGGGQGDYDESASVAASGTGTTRTCTLKTPYAWSLGDAPVDFLYTTWSVTGQAGTTGGLPQRTVSNSLFDQRNVPPNGAITTLTAAVTM
jgi:hypothetical protein